MTFYLRCELYQAFGGVGGAVEDDILNGLKQFGSDVIVAHGGGRVDDTHIHTGLDGMVEKHGVHGFAQIVVATESEGEVAHTTAHMGTGQMGAYPFSSAYEVEGICIVCLNASGYGEDIGVEDDVLRSHTYDIDKQMVGTLADGDAALIGVGLSLFVEGHDHDGSTEAAYLTGMGKERLFALLEGYGVDHALTLYALDGGCDDLPVGRVDHDGYAGDIGL